MDENTKIYHIKHYLEKGGIITDVKAWKIAKTFRLSAIIYELRHRYDMQVSDRWVINPKTHTKYKEYWLPDARK